MNADELALVDGARKIFHEAIQVNCTGCAYCMPCPFGVNIPSCFSNYNSKSIFGGILPTIMYNHLLAPRKNRPTAKASACKKCGACEKKCPQNLPIMADLERTAKAMENPIISLLVTAALRISRQ